MCSLRLVALGGLLVAQVVGAAAANATGATQPPRQVEKVARAGERELALSIDFVEALGGRSAECPPGQDQSGCWLFFMDELPARFTLNLWLADALDGDSGSGKTSRAQPLSLTLPADGWWKRAALRVECPELPGADPGVRFVPAEAPPPVLREHEPAKVECVIESIPHGDWIVSATLDAPLIGAELQHLQSSSVILSVREGHEDESAAWYMGGREARRALAEGDFAAYERIALRLLAMRPSAGFWESLAERSLGNVPLATTASYYARAREQEELRFKAAAVDPAHRNLPETRTWHDGYIARLSTFEHVLPYLEANPDLRFHPPENMYGVTMYSWGSSFGVSGPGVAFSFETFDDTVRARLDAAVRQPRQLEVPATSRPTSSARPGPPNGA
jgi:hypothetical protein